ncbi:MAG TPA: hypothetical protein VNC50_19285, partial [Planctomycetia bacterium]|nr:hypothetical protein [Planctomycetia bacterium]
ARAEREFRCDDRAVAAAGCAATYVRLLAALENARPRRFQPASSLAGSLAARCARLLGCERQTFPRGLVVAGALALLLGFATAHAIASNKPPEKSKLLWCGCAMGPP